MIRNSNLEQKFGKSNLLIHFIESELQMRFPLFLSMNEVHKQLPFYKIVGALSFTPPFNKFSDSIREQCYLTETCVEDFYMIRSAGFFQSRIVY